MSCRVLVLYWSKGGNTRKVPETIHTAVKDHGRPFPSDLQVVAGRVSGLLRRLQHKLGIEAQLQMKSDI